MLLMLYRILLPESSIRIKAALSKVLIQQKVLSDVFKLSILELVSVTEAYVAIVQKWSLNLRFLSRIILVMNVSHSFLSVSVW